MTVDAERIHCKAKLTAPGAIDCAPINRSDSFRPFADLHSDFCQTYSCHKTPALYAEFAVFAVLASMLLSAGSVVEACYYDPEAMMSLDQKAFDQSLSGWRTLERNHCFREAADVIRAWRMRNRATATIIFWQEGQMRAEAGQVREAISLFRQSKKRAGEEMAEAWNIYVDGSIAFLKRDRESLLAARERLAVIPKPKSFNPLDTMGRPLPVSWPPNLAVLDGLARCWDEPYVRAYSCGYAPTKRPQTTDPRLLRP